MLVTGLISGGTVELASRDLERPISGWATGVLISLVLFMLAPGMAWAVPMVGKSHNKSIEKLIKKGG
jgi:hypothetical protein